MEKSSSAGINLDQKNEISLPTNYSIRVYKQYFNFASSHFLVFADGTREPLHGHNYRVQVTGQAHELRDDMVFDFLHIKPIVREICNSLDHRFLLPIENKNIEIIETPTNLQLKTPDGSFFSFPISDVIKMPLSNISAERLAVFLALEIEKMILDRYQFQFLKLEVEVEETAGQAAVYCLDRTQNNFKEE